MIIECVPHPELYGRLLILVDEDPWRTIHPSLFGKNPSFPPSENLSTFEELFKQIELDRAKHYALRCLARKEYLSHELKKKLSDLHISEEAISKVLGECKKLGYLNDQEWIQRYIAKQTARRYGPQAIAQQLRQKGIPSSDIPVLQNSSSQKTQIQQILNSRFKSYNFSNPKEKQKAIGFLVRRGFNFSLIFEAFDSND